MAATLLDDPSAGNALVAEVKRHNVKYGSRTTRCGIFEAWVSPVSVGLLLAGTGIHRRGMEGTGLP